MKFKVIDDNYYRTMQDIDAESIQQASIKALLEHCNLKVEEVVEPKSEPESDDFLWWQEGILIKDKEFRCLYVQATEDSSTFNKLYMTKMSNKKKGEYYDFYIFHIIPIFQHSYVNLISYNLVRSRKDMEKVMDNHLALTIQRDEIGLKFEDERLKDAVYSYIYVMDGCSAVL